MMGTLQNTGIQVKVVSQICNLAETYGVRKVILFGSRARGDHHRSSDIDLAVSGGNVKRFALDVDEDTDTLLTYDVVDLDSDLSAALRNAIDLEGIVLYEEV